MKSSGVSINATSWVPSSSVPTWTSPSASEESCHRAAVERFEVSARYGGALAVDDLGSAERGSPVLDG
jgi:hypothetical protein